MMRMYSNMVLLTLEQVTKLYGFTDKHKAKRIIGAPRVSGEHRVMYLSWRRCDRHRQAAYWHCTIKCTRKKIQCKTTTSQPIWLQSRSTAAALSRASVCWTEEQLEQLTALWDTTSRTCGKATVCRYAIRSSTAAMEPVRPVSRSSWSARGTGSQAEATVCAYFQRPCRPAADRRLLRYVRPHDRQLLLV